MCEMHMQTYLNRGYIHFIINGAQQSSVLSPSLFPSLPTVKFQDIQEGPVFIHETCTKACELNCMPEAYWSMIHLTIVVDSTLLALG